MRELLAPAHRKRNFTGRAVLFSVSEARRALPYVARVVRDAADAFRHAQRCRTALQVAESSRLRESLGLSRDEALRRLNSTIDECNAVGADLIDIRSGLVRFHAELRHGPVSLIWRLGEPIEQRWSDLNDQFTPRSDADPEPEMQPGACDLPVNEIA